MLSSPAPVVTFVTSVLMKSFSPDWPSLAAPSSVTLTSALRRRVAGGVGTGFAGQGVCAGTAVQQVVARATLEPVRAVAAVEGVVSALALQEVVAGARR